MSTILNVTLEPATVDNVGTLLEMALPGFIAGAIAVAWAARKPPA